MPAAYEFTQGETVLFDLAVTKTSDGLAASPATSMKITVIAPGGTQVVDAQDMTEDATGDFSYAYTLAAAAVVGTYLVEYAAVNGTKTSIEYDQFKVKARKAS